MSEVIGVFSLSAVKEIEADRDRAYDALSQIKRAMPQLKELLGEYDIIAMDVTKGTANQIKLVALVDATVELIDEVLPDGYGDRKEEEDAQRETDQG